jgi:glutamate-1-semialdehyde 2,1-aminomutase
VDKNSFIDFISGLCPVILGYCDKDVDKAVIDQISQGNIFSLPTELEIEVAELLNHYIPCAEMVRFGLNGSDATTGAVRLARAYTDRDHIACCGYHGWHDWYIGTTDRKYGVPEPVRELTHVFKYNDLKSLQEIFDKHYNQIACVIMEPMSSEWPSENFLEGIKELCEKNYSILIFDEIITGFRWSMGGAQKYFNVIPDLACFGKAMSNGYPLSAIVGKKDIMKMMEKIHYSFTYGGTCIGLAAAKATITKLDAEKVAEYINRMGNLLLLGLNAIINNHKSEVKIIGHPARTIIKFPRPLNKWIFLQEMFSRGILIQDAHNLTYSHCGNDLMKLLQAYDEIIPILDKAEFRGKVFESNFKIRQ